MARRLRLRSGPRPDPAAGMTLVEHLTELRNRLVISLLAVTVAAAVVVTLGYEHIIDILIQPYCDALPADRECSLYVRDPLESFSIRLKVGGWGGLMLAMPVVLWQLWRFVTPGLHDTEKRWAVPFIMASVVLFFSGATVGYLTFPKAIEFFVSIGGENFEALYSPAPYIRLFLLVCLAFGLSFEFPVLLVFLQLARVLTSARLRSWRRYAAVLIVAAAAVITPTQDPYSMMAMAVPMYVFYEVSILIGRALHR